jgi:hypothetical protein
MDPCAVTYELHVACHAIHSAAIGGCGQPSKSAELLTASPAPAAQIQNLTVVLCVRYYRSAWTVRWASVGPGLHPHLNWMSVACLD